MSHKRDDTLLHAGACVLACVSRRLFDVLRKFLSVLSRLDAGYFGSRRRLPRGLRSLKGSELYATKRISRVARRMQKARKPNLDAERQTHTYKNCRTYSQNQ